jgi:hypothetical protein
VRNSAAIEINYSTHYQIISPIMAISKDMIQGLETLKANIQAFLDLHKNPYDTSQYNN